MKKEENQLNSLIDAIGDKIIPFINEDKKQRAALFVVGDVDADGSECGAGAVAYGIPYNISLCLSNAMSRKKNLAKDVMIAAMIEATNNGFASLDDYVKSLFEDDKEKGIIQDC